MLQEDRFLQIIKYLKEHNVGTFGELAETAGASVGTIRRDLAHLEAQGMLSIVRGGAVYHKDDLTKQTFDMRGIENRENKRALSALLGQVITDGQAVALNSGTTNVEAARYLVEHYHRLMIVTNNLSVVDVLKEAKDFTIIVPGGILKNNEHSVFGEECEEEIKMYNLDTVLLAVNSLSPEKGITDFRMEEVGIIRAMIESARTKAVLADHTKFDRVSCMNICGISEIDYILTDGKVMQDQIDRYENQGVKILTPEKNR
jgi:DeoR/GlpR family transcriptional regulator of sugar metabolism